MAQRHQKNVLKINLRTVRTTAPVVQDGELENTSSSITQVAVYSSVTWSELSISTIRTIPCQDNTHTRPGDFSVAQNANIAWIIIYTI